MKNIISLKEPKTRLPAQETAPALIAVMGATGSGKSTFINLASGGTHMDVGDSLRSCTKTVGFSPQFAFGNRTVQLIDTPGFDDTSKSEAEILGMLATYLAKMFEKKQTLSGLIYLHRISDVRMNGMSVKNFRIFRKLCGDDTLKNVVIATNRWEDVALDVGKAREEELMTKDDFFKPAIDKGAQIHRHYNTPESAMAILGALIGNNPLPLLIQTEMINERKQLMETAAGGDLHDELQEEMRRYKEEMQKMQREIEALSAKREEERRELQSEADALRRKLTAAEKNADSLNRDYEELKKTHAKLLKKKKGICIIM